MLAVTARSCIEELKPVEGESEIVICDNSEPKFQDILTSYLPKGYLDDGTIKLIYQNYPCLFTARETAIDHAQGEYIICVDSHMLIGRDMIKDLVEFMDRKDHGRQLGFAHAPISWMHQHERMARHDRDMTKNELGNWGAAFAYETKMTWKGMPWICRKDFYQDVLKGYYSLADHKLSWGGGDMHIGIKPWLLGYPNWAVPTSPGIHCGPFPKPEGKKADPKAKYRLYDRSGTTPLGIGFLVSCYVLGGEPMMHRNKEKIRQRFGRAINPDNHLAQAMEMGQKEKDWLDSVKVTSFEQLLIDRPWDEYTSNSRRLLGSVAGAR